MRNNLKKARLKAQMTQKQVAEILGISDRHYQLIESGMRNGNFQIWDDLEDLFNVHQRILRNNTENRFGKEVRPR